MESINLQELFWPSFPFHYNSKVKETLKVGRSIGALCIFFLGGSARCNSAQENYPGHSSWWQISQHASGFKTFLAAGAIMIGTLILRRVLLLQSHAEKEYPVIIKNLRLVLMIKHISMIKGNIQIW